MTTEGLADALEFDCRTRNRVPQSCRAARAESPEEWCDECQAAARLRELNTALRPFAAVADAMRETSLPRIPDRDDLVLWQRTNTAAPAGYEARITLGDCRRAKAALEAR